MVLEVFIIHDFQVISQIPLSLPVTIRYDQILDHFVSINLKTF